MQWAYFEEKTFTKLDLTENFLAAGEYEGCAFIDCDFSGSDLSEFKFTDCEFTGCNLSLVKLTKTAFRDVSFKNSKMLGLHFENCSGFGLSFGFDNCILDHSSFYRAKLKKFVFKNSQLREVDFSGSDLTGAVFENCDLRGAIFDRTILEKADLRSAFNFAIDPETNRLKKARFSLPGITGLLDKYDLEIDGMSGPEN